MSDGHRVSGSDTADAVRERVRQGYTVVAEGGGMLSWGDHESQARAFGYESEALRGAPRAANLGLGCGNPTSRARLERGDVVLDLGCGAGLDVFLASRSVGAEGRVIGVDMTEALLERARTSAREEGYENVEFRVGQMEALPVSDASVDVVISNCAINLSPEKARVFAEIARVLRPGGRLQISDLVVERELPEEVRGSVEAYIGCVGGAIARAEYSELVEQAGFDAVEIEPLFSLADVVTPDDPRVLEVIRDAGGRYTDAEVQEVLESIVSLSISARAPGCRAAKPEVGCGTQPKPAPERGMYEDLLSYVVSNAVAGEIMAVENYSDMVALLPDVEAKLEAVEQAREEGRHIRQLAKLGRRLGFDVKQRIIEPEWKAVRGAFREAAGRGDLPACLVIQDLMTESLAIVLYRTLSGVEEVQTDALTARVAGAILNDELEHLEIGARRLRELRERDPEAVDAALAWAHGRVMPQLFELMNTRCESLCDELSLDCAALDPSAIGADLDVIRTRAASQYIEALDKVGFGSATTTKLISSLATYEVEDPDSRVCCGPLGDR